MRPFKLLRFFVLNGLAIGLGATVAVSCIDVDYPTVAFQCNPRQADNCPDSHFCCSDDPAAEGGELPSYMNKGIEGRTPIFSGMNNALGTSGLCVRTGDIPAGSGLLEVAAANCPIPCNPTWTANEISVVCGPSRVCCQTVELEQPDCIQDNGGVWRPANGTDITAGRSDWSSARHATHQDPNGTGCMGFAGGGMGEEFTQCVEQLTVADQRGFCMSLGVGQACPLAADPTYINPCDLLNMGGVPPV